MFTGIITDMGEIVAKDGGRFTIACSYPAESIALGASIACDGCCLTATAVAAQVGRTHFTLDVSKEKLENAQGFDKDAWPSMADQSWAEGLHDYYQVEPYWR